MSDDGLRTDAIQGKIVHEYDGIEEADNILPMWWLWTFYGAIVFSVGYWFYYHELGLAPLPGAAYEAEQAERLAAAPPTRSDEELIALAADSEAVEAGRLLYQVNCVACHEAQGEGKIGANLTDRYWIHGGDPSSIHRVIAEGVPAKGMPGWAPLLGGQGIDRVTAFVLTLRGRNLQGKAAEGEPWPADLPAELGGGSDADADPGAEPEGEAGAALEGEAGAAPEEEAGAAGAAPAEGSGASQ